MPVKTKKKTRKKSIKKTKKIENNFIAFLRDQNGMVRREYLVLVMFIFVTCSIVVISYMSMGYLDNL